ncbi:hypothetical protein Tsubulata_013541, partial [Turnera subulata]
EFAIHISTDLVNRLTDDGEKARKKPARRTKPRITRDPAQPRAKANEKQLHYEPDARKGTNTSAAGWSVQQPLFAPVAPPVPVPSKDAKLAEIQSVIQQSEKVLEKLQKKEDTMVQEVTARAKELRDKEFKLPYQKPMPCLSDYEGLRECYKEHAKDILKCGPLTKSYYEHPISDQLKSGFPIAYRVALECAIITF